ncbi:DUF5631 domain-containing protein [Mycobacterium paraintracellulare]|uniref:DUF5631 domain-containing protein n=1 Tax=Mycobacterium paraintracellulare TaxID=1138383 RepID=UPI0019253D4F|nr:DUF5631 domain-containing protein [Mycobacterium paraintracellulare]BCO86784.1 hypothetical protein MINTM015_00410 [Mycobacterium paraintracellulare]
MAIFGRMTARQRLRRATRESLAIPAFSAPIDCTPWVTGGLWPAELSTVTAETATLAEYLKADLQRIANGANDQLKMLKRAGMTDPARQAAEARVIEEARGRAVRRVESTIRYLHTVQSGAQPPAAAPPTLEGPGADLDRTQVLPAVREVDDRPAEPVESVEPVEPAEPVEPEAGEPEATHAEEPAAAPDVSHLEETQVIPVVSEAEPVVETPVDPEPEPVEEPAATGRHHAVVDEPAAGDEPTAGPEATPAEDEPADVADASHLEETQVIPVVTDAEPPFAAPADRAPAPVEEPVEPVENGRHHAPAEEPAEDTRDEPAAVSQEVPVEPAAVSQEAPAEEAEPVVAAPTAIEKPVTPTGFDNARLNRLLEFVVRQEPRLSWAIGDRADGTTVLVTDLAHGWIPSGISLPAGVRLLEPERRGGRVAALIGDTARVVTYAPGDSLRRSADFAATRSSVEPRQLPAIDDLARVLSQATRAHAELPKIVTRLADATAAGTFVVDQEVDVLRVHLDTARYQLLVQYPNVNPGLLLKCMLMAATEGIASGDTVSANYHLAWYRMLAGSTPGG